MNRVFEPGLHVDLVSYWPLEETSGTILHDVSMYGSSKDMTEDFVNNLAWVHDTTLKGRLLFSRPYQLAELSDSRQLIPRSVTCAENCLYCSSVDYCKACVQGMYLKDGVCVSTSADVFYYQDHLEKEFKVIPVNPFRIARLWADGCNTAPINKEDLDKCTVIAKESTFCIRNSARFEADCYKECPEGNYLDSNLKACKACTDPNCAKCEGDICFECIKGYSVGTDSQCTPSKCGNGVLEAGEECDDGNLEAGDGCSPLCAIEGDFNCFNINDLSPSICIPICGDGFFYGVKGEECDDGNRIPDDGCNLECKVNPGWWCINGSPTHPSECFCHPRYLKDAGSFSEDYMTLYLRFSVPIELKKVSADLCWELFGEYTKLFGENYDCAIEGNTIVVHLGDFNEIYQDVVLHVNEGLIGALDCSSSTFTGEVIVPEIKEQKVSGTIDIEDEIGWCEKTTMRITDITGGLHRPYNKVAIRVESIAKPGNKNIDSQEAFAWKILELQRIDHCTYYIEFPKYYFVPGSTYKLSLDIINFQNRPSEIVTKTVEVKEDYLVRAFIEGLNGGVVDTTEDLVIRTVLSLSTCNDKSRNVSDIETTYRSL